MSSKKQHLFKEGESVVLVPGFDITTYEEADEEGGIFRIGREEENAVRMELLSGDAPQILIHEPITFRTADYVRKAVTFVQTTRAKLLPVIEVEITTPGGSVEASFEIYNRFKNYPGGVVGTVQGYVTEHLLSCPSRLERLHRDVREDNERLLKICVERVHLCQPHKKIPDIERQLRKIFTQERFLYAEKAQEEGLCDIVGVIKLERVEEVLPIQDSLESSQENGELSHALKKLFGRDKKETE